VIVNNATITEALGNKKIDTYLHERITRPGVAIGMAYTEVGGRALLIETAKFPGSAQLVLTGQLGDVMKESISTALSWIKTNAQRLGLTPYSKNAGSAAGGEVRVTNSDEEKSLEYKLQSLMRNNDLHVHFPAAATPKDGPSAGVAITVALVSLFSGRRVRSNFAMTGEISLQGLVMPVGGIKEKCMAAHRNGIEHVILPWKNREDLEDVPEDLRKGLKAHFVHTIEEALNLALEREVDPEFFKEEVMPFFRAKL